MFGIFKKHTVQLSPEVYGQVQYNGDALAHMTIHRDISYGDVYSDSVTTDEKGRFHFEEKNIESSKPGNMFDNEGIAQAIYVIVDDKKYTLWGTLIGQVEGNDIVAAKLKDLHCDIGREEKIYDFEFKDVPGRYQTIYGVCNLD